MKKLFIILTVGLIFASCRKTEPMPNETVGPVFIQAHAIHEGGLVVTSEVILVR